MSAKELVLKFPGGSIMKLKMIENDDRPYMISCDGEEWYLDRGQAHMLFLYLQEHLKS